MEAAPHSQWRYRAGFAPASLLCPRRAPERCPRARTPGRAYVSSEPREARDTPRVLNYRYSSRVRGVLLLGCGYTATRVAGRLRARAVPVLGAARGLASLAPLGAMGASTVSFDARRPETWDPLLQAVVRLGPDYRLLVSVPPVEMERGGEATGALLRALPPPSRAVYLSTTSVYASVLHVDVSTPPSQGEPRQRLRLEAEEAIAAIPSHLILRAAAIYGPDRGLHVVAGQRPRRSVHPDRLVSRIHVDDLAALCAAALDSELTGALPVADSEPATGRAVAAFCASLGLVLPPPEGPPGESPRYGRSVDGRRVCELLGVRLAYPSFRDGIRAALRTAPGSGLVT